ncbi:MAG: PAS domain S-box protein, partial [Solirubrobacteraceae bacterium]
MSVSLPLALGIGASGLVLAFAMLTRFLNRLREQKTLFNELFEQSPQAAAVTTMNHRIIRVNRKVTEVFGYTLEAAIGRGIGELIVPAESQDEYRIMKESVARGERVEKEGICRRRDGSPFHSAITMAPLSLPGQEAAVYATYREITKPRREEEAGQATEGRWRSIFDNSAVGIAQADAHGKYTAANRAFQEMVGYSEEELRALSFMDLTWEEDRAPNAALFAELFAGKLPWFQLEK